MIPFCFLNRPMSDGCLVHQVCMISSSSGAKSIADIGDHGLPILSWSVLIPKQLSECGNFAAQEGILSLSVTFSAIHYDGIKTYISSILGQICLKLLPESYWFTCLLIWMGPFLRSRRKAATHYGHSYALSMNWKCEKPFGCSVKIFGVLQQL